MHPLILFIVHHEILRLLDILACSFCFAGIFFKPYHRYSKEICIFSALAVVCTVQHIYFNGMPRAAWWSQVFPDESRLRAEPPVVAIDLRSSLA